MNKDFVIGFLTSFCLMALMGSTSQISNKFDETRLYTELIQMRKDIDSSKFMILKSTPLASSLVEGQGVIVSTGTRNLMFRVDSATYTVLLTKN